jgi:hypothetical protein
MAKRKSSIEAEGAEPVLSDNSARSLCRSALVVIQKATEALAAANGTAGTLQVRTIDLARLAHPEIVALDGL